MAAAVWGIEHFDVYLIGGSQAIGAFGIGTHENAKQVLQHLMLEYNFTIEYRAGEENASADYLSRNATTTDTASVQEQGH
jgi:hypothetical protein